MKPSGRSPPVDWPPHRIGGHPGAPPSGDEHLLPVTIRGRNGIHAALRLQERDDLCVGPGAAEQKALPFMTAFRAQAAQFGFGLDALGE
jgi:hypothetical protein